MSAATIDRSGVDRGPRRRQRRRWTFYILPVFTIAMIVYLAAPMFMMIVYWFNKLVGERQVATFTCCTLDWWREIFGVHGLNKALATSITVAIPARSSRPRSGP